MPSQRCASPLVSKRSNHQTANPQRSAPHRARQVSGFSRSQGLRHCAEETAYEIQRPVSATSVATYTGQVPTVSNKGHLRCPYCAIASVENWTNLTAGVADPDGDWTVQSCSCPACNRLIVRTKRHYWNGYQWTDDVSIVKPKGASRRAPIDVTDPYASDYNEAALVLADSAKASAALSRRCLQAVLRDKGGFNVPSKKLHDEIEKAVSSGLPSHIADALHSVRIIGNLAAHPEKDATTGAVVDVEPGEAEWNLDTLDMLFDFCSVAPAKAAVLKAALASKIAATKATTGPSKPPPGSYGGGATNKP